MDTSTSPAGSAFLWEPSGSRPIMTPERLTDEQRAIAASGEEFVEREILTRMKAIEGREAGLMPSLLKKAGELGLLEVDVPSEYGGLGLEKTTSMLLAEKMATSGSFSVSLGAHTGIGTMPIVYFGTPAQKRAYLPDLATGKRIAAYALTEASSGSDALAARTTAVLRDGGWVLNGSKQFITNAGFADVFIVFAKVAGDKFTAFIVDRAAPGLSIGPEEHKMGIRGSSTCPLVLEDCTIPEDAVLGEIGKGHKIAFNTLNIGRIKLGVGTVGACKNALALSARYAKERKQFGRPIADFGLVSTKLAEMAIVTFVAEAMGYRTTGLVDDRLAQAEDDAAKIDAIEEYSVEASIIKVFGSEAFSLCADEAVQVHGGYGFIEEYAAERLLRDSRINRIFEGTNEINRLIVPGTILKRALKGQLPLLARSVEIRGKLAKGEVPAAPAGELGAAIQVAECSKWLATYVLSVAAETYQMKVSEEQEVLGEIADMIGRVYALDSAIARVQQILAGGDARRQGLARDVLAAYVPRAAGFVRHTAHNVLVDISPDGALAGHLANIDRLRVHLPTKVMASRRRIAAAVLEADGWPF